MKSGGAEAIPMYIYSTNWISVNVGYVPLQDSLMQMNFDYDFYPTDAIKEEKRIWLR